MIRVLAEELPAECMTGTFHSHGGIALAVTAVGLVGAIYSLAMGFSWLHEEAVSRKSDSASKSRHRAKSWLLGMWVLLPPLWFYIEDIFLYRHYGKAACFDSFRYAQEIVARGWLVFVTVLTLLYFGRAIFGRE